jgi:hypothetical protein
MRRGEWNPVPGSPAPSGATAAVLSRACAQISAESQILRIFCCGCVRRWPATRASSGGCRKANCILAAGFVIEDGKGATARVTYADQRKGVREMDLTDEEADRLFAKARRAARRGRRPKATAS